MVAVRVVGAQNHTFLAFLSSSCTTCATFWEAFRDRDALRLPDGTRLVVVTKSPDEEASQDA